MAAQTVGLLMVLLTLQQGIAVSVTTVHYGPDTALANDAWTEVACPAGKVATMCECVPEASCDGAIFRPDDKCRASCTGLDTVVKPRITCEDITPDVTYTTVKEPATGKVLKPAAECPEGSVLVGCSIHSPWKPAFPAVTASAVGNTCTTSGSCGSTPAKGCTSYARCKWERKPCEEGTVIPAYGGHHQYLQCGMNGVWFMMECPCDEIFYPQTGKCGPQECLQIFDSNPIELADDPIDNPCTEEAMESEMTTHPYEHDHTKIIKCLAVNVAVVKLCPSMMIWNEEFKSCKPVGMAEVGTYDAPCTTDNIAEGEWLHAHGDDRKKYILCDPNGFSHVISCPEGQVWKKSRKECRKRRGGRKADRE